MSKARVSFSGQPQEGARAISITPVQGFAAPATHQPPSNTNSISASNTVATAYKSVTIITPKNEETIWNNSGNLFVSIATTPPLSNGHRLVLSLDGNKVAESTTQTTFQLKTLTVVNTNYKPALK